MTLKITSDLHSTLTTTSQTFNIRVTCGVLTTFSPQSTTASQEYTITKSPDAMGAATTLTIPDYDMATSDPLVPCTYA